MQTKIDKKDLKLIHQMAVHKIKLQFSDQLFGYAWAIINPLVFIFSYWFFAYVGFKGGYVGEIPFIVWLVPGMLAYKFIANILAQSSTLLSRNAQLIKETSVKPHYIPLIEMLKESYIHVIVMFIMFVIYAIIGYTMTGTFEYLPKVQYINFIYYWITMFSYGLALSYCVSAIGIMFRDIKNIVAAILVPLFWMTPVLYPVENGIKPTLEKLEMIFNPFYFFINGYRTTMVYNEYFFSDVMYNLYIWVVILTLALLAKLIWRFVTPMIADLV